MIQTEQSRGEETAAPPGSELLLDHLTVPALPDRVKVPAADRVEPSLKSDKRKCADSRRGS